MSVNERSGPEGSDPVAAPLRGRTAAVTGASHGIGRAIALSLAANGARVYLLARSAKELADVARTSAGECCPLVVDLTRPAELERAAAALAEAGADLLVHSAGQYVRGYMEPATIAALGEQLALSASGPYLLTCLLLPQLRMRHSDIVFVNSSVRPAKGLSAYSAGQSAQRAIADSLRDELGDTQVRVLSIFPGRTAGRRQQNVFDLEGRAADYRPELLLQPEDIATVVVDALSLPRRAEITEIWMRPSFRSY